MANVDFGQYKDDKTIDNDWENIRKELVAGLVSGTDDINTAGVTCTSLTCTGNITPGTVADDNVVGGMPVIHRIDLAAGANADTDVTLTNKTRVIDAWIVLTGAGVTSATYQVKNGANAITDEMAASGSDTALVRAATINDANHEIAAAGTLRITGANGATQPAATCYVMGILVA